MFDIAREYADRLPAILKRIRRDNSILLFVTIDIYFYYFMYCVWKWDKVIWEGEGCFFHSRNPETYN